MTTNLTIPYYAQQRLANLTQIDLEVMLSAMNLLEIRNEAKRP